MSVCVLVSVEVPVDLQMLAAPAILNGNHVLCGAETGVCMSLYTYGVYTIYALHNYIHQSVYIHVDLYTCVCVSIFVHVL